MTAPVQVGPSPQGGGPVPCPDWDDLLADIGDRVRAERQARGWSQTELARRAGFALNTAKRLEEAGAGTLRVFVLACAALGVEMSLLLSDEWQLPERRPSLTDAQVKALRAVAGGEPLSMVAERLGMPRDGLASRLSEIYRRLGVTHVSRGFQRRMAAVDAARKHGLLYPQ
ncbi:helix-turn-helix domain-containing protein [Streptomyces sp. NBC_00878]|uniref:helix-turn-helix domain-containing protein n=1 Tax=Streptomyces sp. NBC_00878 TaxID=2975854 RepID=UPI0022543972|nr:helix-turn-helix domain-containing protein [Streptomyces sp. NBC_00878]MCX4911866.1 helix-turn-helix domain-containing protein [Streptomyces sp. NBC_00878]